MKREPSQSTFEVEQTNHGYRYLLPARDLGEWAKIGWLLFGVGLVVSLFMIAWMAMPAVSGFRMLQQGQIFGLFFLLFAAIGLIGFRYGTMMIAAGYTVLTNRLRCEVEIKKGYLYSTELIGWFRFRRYLKLDKIKRLEITMAPEDDAVRSSFGKLFNDMAAIVAATKETTKRSIKKPEGLLVAPAYPREVLDELAQELAVQLNRELATVELPASPGRTGASRAIAVVDIAAEEINAKDLALKQPEASKIEVANVDGTLAFKVPKQGFAKQTGCLFAFGMIWIVFPVVGFVIAISGGQVEGPVWIVFPLFLLIGVGIAILATNMAVKSEMIGVANGLLFIEKKSLFGTKWSEFQAADISRISVGPSGMEVNDQPVMELQIFDRANKKTGLLSRLEDDELHWLRQELTNVLGVTAEKEKTVLLQHTRQSENWPAPPPKSRIDWKSLGGRNNQWIVRAKGIKFMGATTVSALIALNSIGAGITFFMWGGDVIFGVVLLVIAPLILFSFSAVAYLFATRGYQITTTEDELTVAATGAFSSPPETVRVDQIRSVDVVDSGWEINGSKIKQLAIKRENGSPVFALFGCETAELAYMCAHLLEWARLGSTPGESVPPGESA